jgi:hypothetical protein
MLINKSAGFLETLLTTGKSPPIPGQPQADDYLSKMTPQEWSSLYEDPEVLRLKKQHFPTEERWDHPNIDAAILQAAERRFGPKKPVAISPLPRTHQENNMNKVSTLARQHAALNFGLMTGYQKQAYDFFRLEKQAMGPLLAAGARLLPSLASRFGGFMATRAAPAAAQGLKNVGGLMSHSVAPALGNAGRRIGGMLGKIGPAARGFGRDMALQGGMMLGMNALMGGGKTPAQQPQEATM